MMSILRLIGPSGNKATSSRNAPAPGTDGKAKGSPSTKIVRGMQPQEARFTGYLMARSATHQKVEGQDLKNLRLGQGSVQKVCDSLPLGRANVIQDMERNRNGQLPLRKMATHDMVLNMMDEIRQSGGEPTVTDFYRGSAGATLYAKTGTCGSFAAVNAPAHATRLHHMKDTRSVVAQAKYDDPDHSWVEMLPKGRREDGTPILHGTDVIMDGWSKERLAVLREDSHFARLDKDGKADHLTHQDFLDHRTGPEAMREVLRYKARIDRDPHLQQGYWQKIREFAAANIEFPEGMFWNETSIFHSDFRKRAGMALHPKASSPGEGSSNQIAKGYAERSKHAFLSEIQAVGVSRSLGANIQGALAEAPRILASAREMFPDPR